MSTKGVTSAFTVSFAPESKLFTLLTENSFNLPEFLLSLFLKSVHLQVILIDSPEMNHLITEATDFRSFMASITIVRKCFHVHNSST